MNLNRKIQERENMKRKRKSRINRMLEIPKEIYSENSKMTLNGFNEIIIENYKGIFEYNEMIIKVSTYIGTITILGMDMILENLDNDDLSIKGTIEKIEFDKSYD